jgi:hypothetical protein
MATSLFFGLLLCAAEALCQLPDSTENAEIRQAEDLFDRFENETDDLQLVDDLTWRLEHPYDLNAITREELESIPGVTPVEADALLEFRRSLRKFTTIEQLKVIEGIGETIYSKLAQYVTVSRDKPGSTVQLRSRTTRDLQPRRGDLDSTFIGSPLKSYNRLTIATGDIQAGVLFEKDGGERFSNGFVSGYASVRDIGFISSIAIGDFNVEAGQGLVLWRGTAFGKGSEAVSVAKKSGLGAQPYHSTDEFNFFRGLAASSSFDAGVGRLDATAFFSRRLLDGATDTLGEVSSFYEEGLFRTQSELNKQKSVTEQVVGGRMQLTTEDGWSIGSTGYRATFDKKIASDRAYEFNGSTIGVIGVDAAVTVGRHSSFGEVASSGGGEFAGIAGTILNLGARSNVALVYRDYARGFNNFHASGFGEHSDSKNERGFYVGIDVRALNWLRLSGYVDQFRFPWRTFSNPLPTSGHEILAQVDASLSRKVGLLARFTHKSTVGTESEFDSYGRDTRPLVDRSQQKYRLTVGYKVAPRVKIGGRLELTDVSYKLLGKKERGYLLYQDVRWTISKSLSMQGRLVFFNTDSYDSRLYEYENDLRGVFSNPGLYGLGRRMYVILRYNVPSVLTLSAKYSETQKEGVASLGSGSSEIIGDLDNRISLQVDITL